MVDTMFADEARDLLLSQPAAEESTPFGPEVLVYKVGKKMFATLSPEDVPARMNLKCDPDRALELRDEHASILPGYHMSKRHWNTLLLDQSLGAALIGELIEHSYDLVRASLTKKVRATLPVHGDE
jgi:predicted DNA-binding protein (MmcQ/YjbR family)